MYEIESYDMWDAPSERTHLKQGTFPTALQALTAARAVVVRSLIEHKSSSKSAEDLRGSYSRFGEVPMIFGEPKVEFDPFAYADEIAAVIFAALNDRAAQ